MEGGRRGLTRKTEQARTDTALVQVHCSARGPRKAEPQDLELDQIMGAQGTHGGNTPVLLPADCVTLCIVPVFSEPPTPRPSDESSHPYSASLRIPEVSR